MSELSKRLREERKDKARRLASADPHQKVDASSWTPPEAMDLDVKTGERPVSRRQYKAGGKVAGAEAHHHAGKKPRAKGGRLANELANTNVRDANEEREGVKHTGGFRDGGRARAHRMLGGVNPPMLAAEPSGGGGPLAPPISSGMGGQGRMAFNYPAASRNMVGLKGGGRAKKASGGKTNAEENGMRPKGGRDARKHGGKLDAAERKALPKSEFGLPSKRKYPMPDKSHAGNAKARASQAEHEGRISESAEEKIDAKADRVLARKMGGHIPDGGWGRGEAREHHAKGGKAGKGKMSVNIVIAPGHGAPPQQPMPGGAPPQAQPRPPGVPVAMPPPTGAMPGGMPGVAPMPYPIPMGGMGQGMPPQMPRKRGGRLPEAGAGSGLGRLEKIKAYGEKAAHADPEHY